MSHYLEFKFKNVYLINKVKFLMRVNFLIKKAPVFLIFVVSLTCLGFSERNTSHQSFENGLKLVIIEDHSAPTVVQMTIVQAGSLDEVNGKTGVAHVLEHMMFKRTETRKEGEFSKIINRLGGIENAFTSKEITGYHQQVHKNNLETIIKLEADRMQNLIFNNNDFEKEKKVVLQERLLRTDDNPKGMAYEALFAQAFLASPVRRPIIGWRDDINNLTINDAEQWYKKWYVPNNITVIIAGAVETKQVEKLIKKYYGSFTKVSLPSRKPQKEPPQTGQRRIRLSAPAENKFILKLWKAPVISPRSGEMTYENEVIRNVIAMAVLGTILGDEDTGVLVKNLVRGSRKAASISIGSSWMSRGPGYFVLDATPARGTSLIELESEIENEIKSLLRNKFPDNDLRRVKRQAKADQIFQKDSLMSQVREISTVVSNGRELNDGKKWLKVLDKITFEDIVSVGEAVIQEEKSTVLEFYPARAN